jgi:Na+-driven multidrug efflux pump
VTKAGIEFYAFFALIDANKGNGTGIMRGLSLMKPLSLIVFISYYLISPPFEYLFGYTCGLDVRGLWAG